MSPHHTHRHHRWANENQPAESPDQKAARKLYPIPPDASQATAERIRERRQEYVEALNDVDRGKVVA